MLPIPCCRPRRLASADPGARPGRAEPAARQQLLGRDDQVGPLGVDHDPAHQITDGEPGATLEHALPVYLGGLVGGPAGALEVLVLGRLDQDLDLGSDPVLGPLRDQLVDQRGNSLHPDPHLLDRHLVRISGGLGAVLVGVAEHTDRVQPGLAQERLQLGQILLGLPREADDHIAADAGLRGQRPDPCAQLQEIRAGPEAAHPAQHRRAGVLERQVEVRRDARGRGDHLEQVRAQLGRLQVGQPDPVDPRHVGEPRQELDQCSGAAGQVLAVGRGVLADQHQLADPVQTQPGRLGHQVVRWAGHERAAERRDRAERAAPVAARGELEVGHRAVGKPGAGHVRHPGVPGDLHVRGGGRPVHRRDRQQRAPVDRRVRDRRVPAEHIGQPLGQLGVGVEAEHGVRLGQAVGQLLPVALGQATHRDHFGAGLRRGVRGGQQRVDGVLLGLLDEAAGVHEDHVRRVRTSAVGVDQLPAAADQPAGQLLRVDLVAGAAQGDQGGTPRGVCGRSGGWHAHQGIWRARGLLPPWQRQVCGGPGPPT